MEGIGTRQLIHHHLVQMVTIPKESKPASKNTMVTGVDTTIPKCAVLTPLAMSIMTIPEAPTEIGAQGGIMKSEIPPWLQGTTMPQGNQALQGPGVIAMMT